MTDDKPAQPPKTLSRQDAKRIRNLNTAAIARMTDDRDRVFETMKADLKAARVALNAANFERAKCMSLLEACVRRYGNLTFDRRLLESVCARGRVSIDIAGERGERVSVRMRDAPELVADADIIDATPDAS